MAFTQKLINVAFTLANGQFAGGGNTANLEGLRISARIDGPGGQSLQTASVSIWGMPLSMMNQLSLIGNQWLSVSPTNTISITAGDSAQNLPLVFQGNIRSAFVDAASQPQVCFRIEAMPGAAVDAMPGDAGGSNGTMDVAQKMQTLASKAGWEFENNGVNITLRNQYLWGSVGSQIRHLAHIAPCEFMIDRNKLTIWISGRGPDSGITLDSSNLVSYPTFSQAYIFVKVLFNSSYRNGQIISVKSSIAGASGKWQINRVTHEIESNIPKGKWFTVICGTPFTTENASN